MSCILRCAFGKFDEIVRTLPGDVSFGQYRHVLGVIAVAFLVVGAVAAWAFRTLAPAASVALVGAIASGVAGFLIRASEHPTFAPAAAAEGATLGLVAFGIVGLILGTGRSTASDRRRAALAVLCGGIVSAGALTVLLLTACPLYVTHAGYCSYGETDVLGGWVTYVVVLFGFDVLVIAGLVVASGRQRRE
jgi:hypothetical protein